MAQAVCYFVVDAFTARPFSGNPAAVVLLDDWRDDAWLQAIAEEMNLPATAYLTANATGYDLRWFTPKIEVPLCGHATLASALVLSHIGKLSDGSDVVFSTKSGVLRAGRRGDRIQIDFPINPALPDEPPVGLVESLNAPPLSVSKNSFDYLVEVESEDAVRQLAPDFRRMLTVDCRGVIVTARSSDPRFDFVSRFFAPSAGIDEDPVTGSAHCSLADHWGKRLGKSTMIGYQASSRGGVVHVEVRRDRVILGGDGVVVAQGALLID